MIGTVNLPGQYLPGMIEHLPDALVAIDEAGKVIAWNRAMESFTGVKAGDVIGKGDYEYALPFYERRRPLLIDLLDSPVEQVKADYTDVRQGDNRLEGVTEKARLRGDEVVLWGMASKLYDERGNAVGAIETIRDFTSPKRKEKRLEKEKIRSETFLDLLCHDVNNRNQIAIGYIELAGPAAGPEDALPRSPAIETLVEGSRLIHLLDTVQREHSTDLNPVPVDLGTLLSEVQAELISARGKGLNIRYAPVQGCHVIANRLLKDLFLGIVGSSVRNVADGPNVSIVLDRHCENGKDYYRVVIEDDGAGLPDRIKQSLFSPEPPAAGEMKMYGLRLYLIKCLADASHSKAWVEDRIKGDHRMGSRFVIFLPMAQAA
jgi:PAS domain S-box-containing protein